MISYLLNIIAYFYTFYIVEWRGTLIPQSTWIMANMTDAHLNPEKYRNPEKFSPERFIGKEETMASSMNQKIEDRDHFNFGWGR